MSHDEEAMKRIDGVCPSDAPRYRAFVSYRHADIDSKVAATVQRSLERFPVPKALRGTWGAAHIAPVFRDKEELAATASLGAEIDAALRGADALVVICSPRTQESTWVMREIDLFLSYHPRDRAFVVLAEGEPTDVIPEQLLHDTRVVEQPDGTVSEESVDVEPLACDLRESARRERRTEITRLAAAILDVSYNSLARRTQRRQARIAIGIASAVAAVAIGVAAFALWSRARIDDAYRQTLEEQSHYLVTEAQEALADGDRLRAIELASAALPASGEDRPLSLDAMRTLSKSTNAYANGTPSTYWMPAGLVSKHQMKGTVTTYGTSENEHWLAATDDQSILRIWDLETNTKVQEISLRDTIDDWNSVYSDSLVITDDGHVAVDDVNTVACFDASSGKVLWTRKLHTSADDEDDSYTVIRALHLKDQRQIIALGGSAIFLLDIETGDVIQSIPYGDDAEEEYSPHWIEGGWNPETNQLVIACISRNMSVSQSPNTACKTLLINLSTSSVKELSGVSTALGDPQAACFLDADTLLLAGWNRDTLSESYYYSSYTHSQESLRSYERPVVRVDLADESSRWATTVGAHLPSHTCLIKDLGSEVKGYEGKRVAALAFSNVVELMDADSGKLLKRFETSSSIVDCWPDRNADSANALYGVTCDGDSFTVVTVPLDDEPDDARAFCIPGQFVTGEWPNGYLSKRISSGLLLAQGDTVYHYADALESDESHELWRTDPSVVYAYSTAKGTLVRQYDNESSLHDVPSFTMLDTAGQKVLWTKSFEEENVEGLATFLNDPTNDYHLALYFMSMLGGSSDRWVSIDLEDGSETWHNAESYWHEGATVLCQGSITSGSHAVSIVPKSRRAETELIEDGTATQKAGMDYYVVTTDLVSGVSTAFPLSELDDANGTRFEDPVSINLTSDSSLSPTGNLLLLPLESNNADSPDKKRSRKYALLDLEHHTLSPLSASLTGFFMTDFASQTPAVWSEDGERLVCQTENGVAVFGADGSELCSFPTDGKQIPKAHLVDDLLVLIVKDQSQWLLSVYDATTGELVGHNEVDDSVANASILHWMPATAGDRDPGTLCLVAENERIASLISLDPFGVCQNVEGCIGYDDNTRSFILREDAQNGDASETILYAKPRLTLDDLLALGQEQVGESAMSNAERQSYGLPAKK